MGCHTDKLAWNLRINLTQSMLSTILVFKYPDINLIASRYVGLVAFKRQTKMKLKSDPVQKGSVSPKLG